MFLGHLKRSKKYALKVKSRGGIRKNQGETYIGNPCKKAGHVLRYKGSGSCVQCNSEANRQRNLNKKGKIMVTKEELKQIKRDMVRSIEDHQNRDRGYAGYDI